MRAATDTKSAILERAMALLQSKGYDGFSYKDISGPMGVKNAAIHYHYPSKTDLALAMIDRYQGILREKTASFMGYGGSAREQLEGFFFFTRHECESDRTICPLGALSVNIDSLDDKVVKALQRFMKDSHKWLTRVLEVGREQGEVTFEGDAEKRAWTLLSVFQGARQLVRLHGFETLEAIIEQERAQLGIN
jgi:AcrR family transcriptional regulator